MISMPEVRKAEAYLLDRDKLLLDLQFVRLANKPFYKCCICGREHTFSDPRSGVDGARECCLRSPYACCKLNGESYVRELKRADVYLDILANTIVGLRRSWVNDIHWSEEVKLIYAELKDSTFV
jgi:hypothetical protein